MSLPKALGFIGLGTMGLPMAKTLLKKCSGSYLYVYDINSEAMESFAADNPDSVTTCPNPRAVADRADVLISMVPAGPQVIAVYLDPDDGVLAANVGGKLLVDCSTIDIESFKKVHARVGESHPDTHFYDAPVSGGSLGAEAGTLTFMVGCSETDPLWDTLRRLLECMGTSIFACGGQSLGLTAKQCNNYCSGLIAIATSEAMNIGMRSGMDPAVLANIFATSTAQSRICDKWNPVPGICPEAPSSHDYRGGFKVELMKKDFGLAVEAAKQVGARLCLGDAGLKTYEEASEDSNCAGRDSRVVFRYIGGNEDWNKSSGK
ncbi:NAD binding domain of 6-phosphogluconate dehydrogenase-domain-containing protein [Pestalotiopsis sp. NC0098]|nr:NAD binding domain of 6-phosphogluconate dehydrogenase-domain-containing protein [Pestalotiopsis sp. NC0098]